MFSNSFPKIVPSEEICGTAGQASYDSIILRMRFACWITESINTHSEYVILNVLPRQQWLHERAAVCVIRILPCCVPFVSMQCALVLRLLFFF